MAFDAFLKLDGIDGESRDDKHKGEIEIESFSFGEAGDVDDSGNRAGKVSMQDFHFVIPTSKATPKLMEKAAKGDKVVSGDVYALLTVRKVGANPVEYLKVKFYDVMISSVQNGVAESDQIPVDQFTLWFGKIDFSYSPQKPDGSLDAPVFFKWDRIKGELWQ